MDCLRAYRQGPTGGTLTSSCGSAPEESICIYTHIHTHIHMVIYIDSGTYMKTLEYKEIPELFGLGRVLRGSRSLL